MDYIIQILDIMPNKLAVDVAEAFVLMNGI